jgi:glycosyltransferase involved in cell wall biosynthesis
MNASPPSKVLIAGGKPAGGVASFAEALRCGFTELGIPAEVAAPTKILGRLRELRDPNVLKILSLAAVFAAPIARRAICVAHGFPCAKYQSWPTAFAVLASFRLATASKGAQLVMVSAYSAAHLNSIFGFRVDAVIHNPVHPIFLEPVPTAERSCEAITYVGRLHSAKHVDRLLPAIRDVLDENPGLRAWIIGDGPMRTELEQIADGDERIEFLGTLSPLQVRDRLRRTRVFVSGCLTEALGLAYLEALSQGCAVAMPTSGGGLEIAPELIGKRIHLFSASISREGVADALRRSLASAPHTTSFATYSPRSVAEAYLAADARFSAAEIRVREACVENR